MADPAMKRPVSILLLEDSELDAELAVARLRKADLAPTTTLARNRAEFEGELLARPYDLILADYALPDFDGVAALSLAREKLPHTPFIFISGRVGEEVAIDTLQRGATDYVLKHRLERLVPAVLRALKEAEEHSTRMQAEARLNESELRFRHVIDAVSQLVWVAAPDGTLTYSNQAWRDVIADGVHCWFDESLFHPSDYPACLRAWRNALAHTEPFTIELRLRRRSDATYRWYLLRVAPMHNPDLSQDLPAHPSESEISWLGTATDLQDQKLNEEALRNAEKLSVTGRLTAAIAHEINNPLESLTNLLFLVRIESQGNERAINYLNMTENELERISEITKQTLQFYRDPVTPAEIDAREILSEVLRLFATRTTAKSISVSFTAESGIVFRAIKGEIRQVIINLVTNAIDAVQPYGHIEVEARRFYADGEPWVEMQVRDDGSGISPEQAERLFQPFFSTKGIHGTGLGLWVSKGIVEKHGGTLRLGSVPADSIPNAGSVPGSGSAPSSGSAPGSGSSRTVASVTLPLQASPELQQTAATAAS